MCCTLGFFQSISFDQLGKEKWLRYNGGVAANAVYFDGTANRQDLTYYLTGNLNFNIAGVYNIPLSGFHILEGNGTGNLETILVK